MSAGLKPYTAYRDSGAPWLGQVPDTWPMERAKWLFHKMDRPVRDSDEVVTCFRDGEVTLRRNRRILGFTESLQEIGYQGIRRGDLVIHAMDAFAGAVGVSDSDGKSTPVYSVCEPVSRANAQYYAYLVREMARTQWILALAKGIRERSTDFRFEAFSLQRVPVPSLPEQTVIVRYLDYMDRRIRRYIRAKQKLIKLLEEQKQVIIHRAVTGQINVRTGKPYPVYKDSGVEWLGQVPQHWDVKKLKDLTKFSNGIAFKPGDWADNGVPIIRIQNLNGSNDFNYTVRTSLPEFLRIRPGDLLFSWSGNRGTSFGSFIWDREFDGFLNQHIFKLHDYSLDRPYFSYLLRAVTKHVEEQTHGIIGLVHVTKPQLGSVLVPVAPPDEQVLIARGIDENLDMLKTLRDQAVNGINLVREYRTRLIADVVTGKLDVRAVASNLPAELDEPESLGGEDLLDETDEADEAVDLEPVLEEAES